MVAGVFERGLLEVIKVSGINHLSQPKFRITTSILVWSGSSRF